MFIAKRLAGWVLAGLLIAGGAMAAGTDGDTRGRAPKTVILKLKAQADEGAVARLTEALDEFGLDVKRYNKGLGHIRVSSERAGLPSEEALAARIMASGAVEFAEPDYIATPVFIPNDPGLISQWFHTKMEAAAAWDASTGSGVVAAVCDTGVDPTHPDLQGNLVTSLGWNTYLNNAEWSDIQGHGTSVAGCIAAIGNNGVGVAGVAYAAKIIPIRVCFDSTGSAYYSDMAEGISYAVDNGAKVVNLSYSGWYGAPIRDACRYAWDRGVTVCVAAGNDGADQGGFAESDYMLLVGATDSSDAKTSWSNYGIPVDLVAPGASIYTTRNGGVYGSVSGTSFSSPITAGLAALVYGVNPAFTPAQVEDIIMSTCVDLGAAGDDAVYGAGRVHASAAVALAGQVGGNAAPVAAATAFPGAANIGETITFDGSASYDVDGQIASFTWTFGDGSSGAGAVAAHAYAAAGTYTAALTVTDDLGATGQASVAVTVTDPSVISAPTSLSATVSSRTVSLRWQDNASNETGYYVERGTYNARTKVYSWTRVATLGANATGHATSATKGTWYYRVQAFSSASGKTSSYSNTVKVNVK